MKLTFWWKKVKLWIFVQGKRKYNDCSYRKLRKMIRCFYICVCFKVLCACVFECVWEIEKEREKEGERDGWMVAKQVHDRDEVLAIVFINDVSNCEESWQTCNSKLVFWVKNDIHVYISKFSIYTIVFIMMENKSSCHITFLLVFN